MKRPLSITLSPDLERFVNAKIEKGYCPSATHLVSGALEALRTQEQLTKGDVAELRQDIKLGLQQLIGASRRLGVRKRSRIGCDVRSKGKNNGAHRSV
jgi:Arc/MetJ-type ribon-helix-helix transcriptional regulator